LGLILGSFVNAWVWRLHEQEKLVDKKGKEAAERRKALSITRGRSMCPDCGHELAAKDLVPFFSWLLLGGKCRYCHKSISWQYPAVEVATGALFALSYALWPYGFHGVWLLQFMLWLGFVVAFMALAVYDLRWFLLPDRIVLPLILVAVAQVVVTTIWLRSFGALWQPAVGALIIFGLFWTLYQVSGGKWIGGGDVKLALALGLLAGTPAKAFLVIFLASLLGTLISLPVLLRGKQSFKLHIPFGPYLLAATTVVVLYGEHVINWYRNLLLG
jgi:leader peptidase (prepilin peptidase)/N-methyltransferase